MFNDALSVDECQKLVSELARCRFPFQCAHGRPSMIPILELSGGLESANEGDDFVNAFREWNGAMT